MLIDKPCGEDEEVAHTEGQLLLLRCGRLVHLRRGKRVLARLGPVPVPVRVEGILQLLFGEAVRDEEKVSLSYVGKCGQA